MNAFVLGAGPAGLYAALLLKKAYPAWDITVVERNPPNATYGWGIVFSDRTLGSFRDADPKTYQEIADRLVLWDVVEVRRGADAIRCGGNLFSGMARKTLLEILQRRCRELGVELRFETEVTDLSRLDEHGVVIAADGLNSVVRRTWADHFRSSVRSGRAKYIWFGTTQLFDAFTFLFRDTEHGLFQAHVYPHVGSAGTFIVECDESTWRRAGLDRADAAESLRFCEQVFAQDLGGGSLLANKPEWLTFPTVRNRTWRRGRTVLLGDAAHTAHFSVGSGTKLAMEDSIALAAAFVRHGEDVETALAEYELERRPVVEALQEAALESSHYFENTSRYGSFPSLPFAFHLLTRSSRTSYDELRRRDPAFVDAVDRAFFDRAAAENREGQHEGTLVAPPPAFAPLRLRGLTLPNRVVVQPTPRDACRDGLPDEAYAAALSRLARAGAAAVLSGLLAVSAEGRITPGCPGLYRAEHAAWLARLAELTHRSRSALVVTLGHAGRRGATRSRHQGLDRPLAEGAWPLVSASAVPYAPGSVPPREATESDRAQILEDFVRAAALAGEAGADALELHFAQGYLLSSFLSPLSNRREDEYGGRLENRARFPLEVLDAVRAAWGAERPLWVAISATDWAKGGFEIDQAVPVARLLRAHGCDLVHVFAGQTLPESRPAYRAYFAALFADRVRNEAGVPTLVACHDGTTDEINTWLAGGRADLCLTTPLVGAGAS